MSKSFTVNKNKFSLRSVILENFRGYLKESEIKFGRKLTLIFGKGSSGKSTILEAVKCLADSILADTDLANIKTKHTLSNKSKTRDFKLGCSVSEGSFSRAFFKKFELTDGEFIPSQIDLHSFSEKEKDGTPIPSTLFASIKNSKISKKHADNLDIAKYYRSQIL